MENEQQNIERMAPPDRVKAAEHFLETEADTITASNGEYSDTGYTYTDVMKAINIAAGTAENNLEEFQYHGPCEFGHFFIGATKKVFIGNQNMDFVYQAREYPADIRIKLMGLSEEEMLEAISNKKKYLSNWILDLLNKKWHWRETGEPIEWTPKLWPNFPVIMSIQMIKNKIKREELTMSQLQKILDFFIGDKAAVYVPE